MNGFILLLALVMNISIAFASGPDGRYGNTKPSEVCLSPTVIQPVHGTLSLNPYYLVTFESGFSTQFARTDENRGLLMDALKGSSVVCFTPMWFDMWAEITSVKRAEKR